MTMDTTDEINIDVRSLLGGDAGVEADLSRQFRERVITEEQYRAGLRELGKTEASIEALVRANQPQQAPISPPRLPGGAGLAGLEVRQFPDGWWVTDGQGSKVGGPYKTQAIAANAEARLEEEAYTGGTTLGGTGASATTGLEEGEAAAKYGGPSQSEIKKLVDSDLMDAQEAESLFKQMYAGKDPRLVTLAMQDIQPKVNANVFPASPADRYSAALKGVTMQDTAPGIEAYYPKTPPIDYGSLFGIASGEYTIGRQSPSQYQAYPSVAEANGVSIGTIGFNDPYGTLAALGLTAKNSTEAATLTLAFKRFSDMRQAQGISAIDAAREFTNQWSEASSPMAPQNAIPGYAGGANRVLLPERTWLVGDSGKRYGVAAEAGEKEYATSLPGGGFRFEPTEKDITLGRDLPEPANVYRFATGGTAITDTGPIIYDENYDPALDPNRFLKEEYPGDFLATLDPARLSNSAYLSAHGISDPAKSAYMQQELDTRVANFQPFSQTNATGALDAGYTYDPAATLAALKAKYGDLVGSGLVLAGSTGTGTSGGGVGGTSGAGLTASEQRLFDLQRQMVALERQHLAAEQSGFANLTAEQRTLLETRIRNLQAVIAAEQDIGANTEAAQRQSARDMFNYRYALTGMELPEEILGPVNDPNASLNAPGARYAIESPAQRASRAASYQEEPLAAGLRLSQLDYDAQQMQRRFAEQGMSLDIDEARILVQMENAALSGSSGGGSTRTSSTATATAPKAPVPIGQTTATGDEIPIVEPSFFQESGPFENRIYDDAGNLYMVDLPGSQGNVTWDWAKSILASRRIPSSGSFEGDLKLVSDSNKYYGITATYDI